MHAYLSNLQQHDHPPTEKHCRTKDELTFSPKDVSVHLKSVILIYKRDFLTQHEAILKYLL